MDLKLRVLEGKHAGQEVPVTCSRFIIGRAEDCQLRPGSDLISRHHCALMVDEGYVAVRDFGSRNGTYVNGERVSGERELKAGDRLKVGPLEFEIHVAHNIGGKKRPPVTDLNDAVTRTAQGGRSQVDVSEWLSDEAPSSARDTVANRVRTGDTEEIDLGQTREIATPSQLTKPGQPVAEEEQKLAAKKEPGKLPPIVKQVSKDSRDAAASILDKFRRRR